MREIRKSLAILLAVAIVFCIAPTMALAASDSAQIAGDSPQIIRINGQNRYDTSAKTALQAFNDSVKTVIIARGEDEGGFADGLAASYLADVEQAPILLTTKGSLPEEVGAAIDQLGAEKAIILGGTNAISENVAKTLDGKGLTVERIVGKNRYDTAAQIAKGGNSNVQTAYVVGGTAKADALLAGPLAFKNGYPILLVDMGREDVAIEAIKDLGVKNIIVIGGEKAVSKSSVDKLEKMATVTRYAGQSRVQTSLEVAKKLFTNRVNFSIVGYSGEADAVGAAVFEDPIFYVSGNNVSGLKDLVATNTMFRIFGGTKAVS
jgi:putative cell wall-binding protein